MALERYTGALTVGSQYAINTVGKAFDCTNQTLQKVLPRTTSTVATTILFAAVSGYALCLAQKAWKTFNAPAPAVPPVNPAAANPLVGAAAAVDPAAVPAPVANPAVLAAPSKTTRYLSAGSAAMLVAASTFINFGLVGINRGGATPLAYAAGAATVGLFAARNYLTAQVQAAWAKFRGPALSAAGQAVRDAEKALKTTVTAIETLDANIQALANRVDAAAQAAVVQLLADEKAAQVALENAIATAAGRWKINFWSNDNKTIDGLRTALVNSTELTTKAPSLANDMKSDEAKQLWKLKRELVTAQAERAVKETSLNNARAELAKKAPAAPATV